ncbi:MAG: glycyl-radical enzyme activating protein [Anaerolineales bacterium]|nr:glycyl-radical enzyme activating protein [Anaerolineales bacterium]
MTRGRILHLQRLSTEDGPGIRTTVFFKGCPLHCAWCHNPEAIAPRMQTQWFAERCLGCRSCLTACRNGCLMMTDDGLVIDRERCQACGDCARACPGGALEALGIELTADDLVHELAKDGAYFAASGGGVTLSGGEPTLQPEFAEEILRGLKQAGIHTALDTCGLCSPGTLEGLLPVTDLVLFDVKLMDDSEHIRLTGQSNVRILENLLLVREFAARHGQPELWIRTPLIPGATTGDGTLSAIGEYLAEHLQGRITRWELCAFNNLCREQYRRLGLEWPYAQTPQMTAQELEACQSVARATGLQAEIVATGATRTLEPV